EMFADTDAGRGGRDRLELATDLDGRIRLHVPHILRRGPAVQEDADDTLRFTGPCGGGRSGGREQRRSGEEATEEGSPAGLKEFAARAAVVSLSRPSQQCQH